eukprot:TRINITY_DN107074_c0_g1_i1.p1 TRINITY_DN107074_c0_g1~~TRINITY_DN107074_c0_g1_i1.p1  ORF type:complete len:231 (-),score=42.34 TRINITY_DN107074_c0_g1_i1:170-862(-)
MSLLYDDCDTIGKRGKDISFMEELHLYFLYVVSDVDESELDLSELGDVEIVLSEDPFVPRSGRMAVLLAEVRAGKAWLWNLMAHFDDLLVPGGTRCCCGWKHKLSRNMDFINPKKPRRFRWSAYAEAGDIWKQYSASIFNMAASSPGLALGEDVTAGYHKRLLLSGFDIEKPIPTTISEKSRHAKFLHTFEKRVVQHILNTVMTCASNGVEFNWKREVVPSSGNDSCSLM